LNDVLLNSLYLLTTITLVHPPHSPAVMVAFSMFSSGSGHGCVVSSGNSSWWTHNCPSDLVERITDAHTNNEVVLGVSVASNGDWFFSTSAFNTGKTFDDVSNSRVAKFCTLATNGGVETDVGNIQWISFMPGAEGFIGATVVDGVEYCFYEGVPQSLETHLSSSKFKSVRWASVGHHNSWVVVYGDSSINWSGIPDALAEELQNGYISSVETVMLSPKASDEFIINYENGASSYVLPPAWGPAIARQEGLLQELIEQTTIMGNEAANTSGMAAASAASYAAGLNALSVDSALATQSWGIF